ncbi:MAG: transcription antitermination factor NusB [Halanaerobiales bacterium]|nr:transcription antitermination factor NusB [Halanaerobiales bacterium]
MKVSRRQERIWALQALYRLDLIDDMDLRAADKGISDIKTRENIDDQPYYFEKIVKGVLTQQGKYDRQINLKAIDWKINRMALIDRNILRIALYELDNNLPVGVVINEAVELAKEYGDEKSASFINGILAKI